MPAPYIRKITHQDNAILANIIRRAFEEFGAPKEGTVYSDPTTDHLYELFETQTKSVCLVAELEGKPIGCCGIFPTEGLEENHAELVKFYLAKEARGKGIGKLLFEQCLAAAKEMGYEFVYIESQPSFSKAVKMYEKYNFRYLDHALGNSGHTNCNLWMIKKL